MAEAGWCPAFNEALEGIQDEGAFGFYADAIPRDAEFAEPHLVWSQTDDTEDNAFEGGLVIGVSVNLDFRAPYREDAMKLRDRVLSALRRRMLLQGVEGTTWLFDEETELRRALVDVRLAPFPPPVRVARVHVRRFGRQFGRQFG